MLRETLERWLDEAVLRLRLLAPYNTEGELHDVMLKTGLYSVEYWSVGALLDEVTRQRERLASGNSEDGEIIQVRDEVCLLFCLIANAVKVERPPEKPTPVVDDDPLAVWREGLSDLNL